MLEVARIGDIASLEQLAPEWNALVERDPRATPFSRPEWLIPWRREFSGGELHCLAMRADGRLVGLLPMFLHEWEGRRQSTLLGNGITDYLDLISDPPFAAECARAVYEYLEAIRSEWDLCDWQDLPYDSPLIDNAPSWLRPSTQPSTPCTRASLPRDAAEFESGLPHGLRRTIRIATRRLEREGELRFETHRAPTSELLSQLLQLHQTRWCTKGGPDSMYDQPGPQRFLLKSARAFTSSGKLRLFVLRWRDEIHAAILALADRERMWGYLTGMNPEIARFSPGSLLLHYAMKQAIDEGAISWEFLRGLEAYKFQWGAREIQKVRLCLIQTKPDGQSERLTPALSLI